MGAENLSYYFFPPEVAFQKELEDLVWTANLSMFVALSKVLSLGGILFLISFFLAILVSCKASKPSKVTFKKALLKFPALLNSKLFLVLFSDLSKVFKAPEVLFQKALVAFIKASLLYPKVRSVSFPTLVSFPDLSKPLRCLPPL